MLILSKRAKAQAPKNGAVVIYHERHPAERVFSVDVGDMNKEHVTKYLEDIKREIVAKIPPELTMQGSLRSNPGRVYPLEHVYTATECRELDNCMQDPVYFIEKYVKVHHPIHGHVDMKLYEGQRQLLDAVDNPHNRKIVCKHARQTGTTSAMLAYILWDAMFQSNRTSLVIVPIYDSGVDMRKHLKQMWDTLPDWLRCGIKYFNRHCIEFDNGSSIRFSACSAHAGRGLSVSILYVDQAAYMPHGPYQEMAMNFGPCLYGDNTKLVIASTPAQQGGGLPKNPFAALWQMATDGRRGSWANPAGNLPFVSVNLSWSQVPDRDEHWAMETRQTIGQEAFNREYMCEFTK